nr:recombinase RecT [Moraxella sp. CTOTU48717]
MSNLAEVMPALPMTAPTTTALSNNGVFQVTNFNEAINAASFLSGSSLVPTDYRRWVPVKNQYGKAVTNADGTPQLMENPNATSNCLIALNMANRMGYDPLMIMQNLYIIEGRPAWSSQFIIAAINACGKFDPLQFEIVNEGEKEIEYVNSYWENGKKLSNQATVKLENLTCIAWTTDKKGNRLQSDKISMEMAVKEGWYQKNGSKWQTMAGQMLRYRAAAFFGRIYAPEILMGIYAADEIRDFVDVTPERAPQPAAQPKQQQLPCYDIKPLLAQIEAITTLEQVRPLGEHIRELSENPNVNLCGDDLPTLRDALTAKRDVIKAQLESAKTDTVVEAEPVANDEPVSEPKEKATLTGEKKVASDLMKLISGMTLDNVNDVRAELYAAQAQLSEATFNQLDAVLESNLEALTQA